jgi:hypothetical protein
MEEALMTHAYQPTLFDDDEAKTPAINTAAFDASTDHRSTSTRGSFMCPVC